jgi:hypothetical protein
VQVWFAPEKLPGSRCGDGKACRVKIFEDTLFEETLWWSFPGAAKKNRTRPGPGRKNWNIKK